MSMPPSGAAERPASPGSTESYKDDYRSQLNAMLTGATEEELEAIAALPSGSALLIVRRGPNAGARFLLDQDTTVAGRHPEAEIFLDDVTVSRKHAEFIRTPQGFEVRDLGSLNGTYFGGERIERERLLDGSEVQVGKYRLTFYAARPDAQGER